jgi:hypothetical protein
VKNFGAMRIIPLLLFLLSVASAEEAANGARDKRTVVSMDQLLELYREFGLPLPPNDAALVQTPTGWSTQSESGKATPILTLGFLLKPAQAQTPPEVLVGPLRLTREINRHDGEPKPVDPDHVAIEKLSFGTSVSTFPLNSGLATAIQCHARGYEKLAQALYEKSMIVGRSGGPSAVSSDGRWMRPRAPAAYQGEPGDAATTILAGTAWTYWLNVLIEPNSDCAIATAAMKRIVARVPAFDDEPKRDLLQGLEGALKPSLAIPGSVEADIDALINCSQAFGTMGGDTKPDAHYQKVLLRGFESVPGLIEHLDDRRMTRATMVGFNNFPTMPRRVGEIAADLLQGIAGEEFSRDWLQRQLGQTAEKSEIVKWWTVAKKMGEEKYLREHVLPHDKTKEWPHLPHVAIIEARYPGLLPAIYEEALNRRPNMQTWPITEAISRADLPGGEKLALFKRSASRSQLAQREPAIRELRKLDPAAADAVLLTVLEKLPPKTQGEVWTSRESAVTHLVMDSASPDVWGALLVAAKRAHVSLRMELMNPLDYTYIGDRQRVERLRFLAQFLDDKTVRNTSEDKKMYDGPCAAFTFPRIAVRDFAAMQIASILKYQVEPDPDWKPQQWMGFRAKVAELLKQERLE